MRKLLNYHTFIILFIVPWLIFSCQNARHGQESTENKVEEDVTLIGWDYLAKIKVNVPSDGHVNGYTCDAILYAKSMEHIVFYKIVVPEDKYHSYEKQEYLVERNPKYNSDYYGDMYLRSYKYKADRYYFSMDY